MRDRLSPQGGKGLRSKPSGRTSAGSGIINAGSSNGRTADFGSVYLGSNPGPAAISILI